MWFSKKIILLMPRREPYPCPLRQRLQMIYVPSRHGRKIFCVWPLSRRYHLQFAAISRCESRYRARSTSWVVGVWISYQNLDKAKRWLEYYWRGSNGEFRSFLQYQNKDFVNKLENKTWRILFYYFGAIFTKGKLIHFSQGSKIIKK